MVLSPLCPVCILLVQRPQGVSSMLPWEILTAETSGWAALEPQIQKHKQAGNAKLQFPPRRHGPHATHILKPSNYIKAFHFMHTEKSNTLKTFSLWPSHCEAQ